VLDGVHPPGDDNQPVRWATYRHPGDDRDRVVGDEVHGLAPGPALVDLLPDLARAAEAPAAEVVPLTQVVLRPPIPHPPSVRDFYAFDQHVRTARRLRGLDMDPTWYELPVFYFSNPHSIVGPGQPVHAPAGSQALDYELEVAAVVAGESGAIAGYCVMNDWSARDLQHREMALNLGPAKGKDFATGLGPFLVTPDELPPDLDLAMTATVNGEEWSRGNLADAHWSFAEMIAYASRDSRVVAGDVIGSGTCGTGCILEHAGTRRWLAPGDVVSLTVEGLGTLTNPVTARA
jgi:fumarylacetoacetate (FAA) hydrolase